MRKNVSYSLIFILISSILLSACGGGGTAEPSAEEVTAVPTATATPDPKLDLDVFMEVLTDSLTAHDFVRLEPLVGTPFSLANIGAGSSALPASELINRLQKNMLPETSTPVFLPDADLSSILGKNVPTTLGPGLEVVSILFSQGWGETGTGEAIIYVSKLPDKTFAWYGMVYAREGFNILAETEEPQSGMDRTDLKSFKLGLIAALSDGERSEETLMPLMNDPFIWAGWQSEGVELAPEEAITKVGEVLPTPLEISSDASPTYTELLDGQDPQEIFPTGVDFIYMTTWGADGAGEAILIIGQNAEGLYTWAGVLNAPTGFQQ